MLLHRDGSECSGGASPNGCALCYDCHHVLVEPVTEDEKKMVDRWFDTYGVPSSAEVDRIRDQQAVQEIFGRFL